MPVMAKLTEVDRQIIRSAPPGCGIRLAELFDVSWRYILQLQSGKRGMPLVNGLGARPWRLKDRELVVEWHRRKVAQADAARDRALKEIDDGEGFWVVKIEAERGHLFQGEGAGKRHVGQLAAQPKTELSPWQQAGLPGRPPLSEGWIIRKRPRRR
jgi:hypothetical protein